MPVELGVTPVSDTQVEVEVKPQPAAPAAPAEVTKLPSEAEAVRSQPKRRGGKANTSGFPWERPPLSEFSVAELLAEVDARRARASSLERERLRVRKEMTDIEFELEAMGITVDLVSNSPPKPAVSAQRQSRARNSVTLADAIAMAVEPRAVVSPAEVAKLVLSNGFVTNSKSFNVQVTNALSKDRRFRRIGRGQYERIPA